MLEIVLNDKGTADQLVAIQAQLQRPNALLKVVGRRGTAELKAHFRARNSTPNKLGGRKTNFWRQIADSVSSPLIESDSRVRINISDVRFAQKVFGGKIGAKNAGALTIPVDAASRGLTVQQFQQASGIQLFLLRKKGGGLSNLLAGIIGEKKIKVFYVLEKEVDQEADPEALPPRSQFNAAILDTAQQQLRMQIRDSGAGT